MLEKTLVGPLSLRAKYLLENQLIDFVSEHRIRKRFRISTRTLHKPFYSLFRELIQPHGSEPLFTINE